MGKAGDSQGAKSCYIICCHFIQGIKLYSWPRCFLLCGKTELHSINKINYKVSFWTEEMAGCETRDLLNTENSTVLKSKSLPGVGLRSWNMKYSPMFIILSHYSKISSHWDFSTCFAITTYAFKRNENDRVFQVLSHPDSFQNLLRVVLSKLPFKLFTSNLDLRKIF